MKERPILFSTPMVPPVLADIKTQTRRTKGIPLELQASSTRGFDWDYRDRRGRWNSVTHAQLLALCPYGVPGDRLWVRETFAVPPGCDTIGDVAYRADLSREQLADELAVRRLMKRSPAPWKPGIHMPRWASRITLVITGVRIERLHAITEDDARAEGVERYDDDGVWYYGPLNRGHACARVAFERLWNEINGAESWAANPFVWAVAFKRLQLAEAA